MRSISATPSFEKKLIRFLKQNPQLKEKVWSVLSLLEQNVHHHLLHTHKLHGKYSRYHACTVAYDCRIAFAFDSKQVYLYTIGSHDEVY